jgi:TetR/AcrR family transcriptional regulator, regulator of cefoperazone and chloramphenicol sensitivity
MPEMSKDDIRKHILLTAGQVFAEKGYKAATVRQICRQAGVNVAAVNYYFGDKQRLYIETVRFAHLPDEELEELPEWPDGTPPRVKLEEFITSLLFRMMGQSAPWQRQLMFREMLNPSLACRELVRTYIRARFDRLQLILDEILPPETPPHKRHQIAFSIIGQVLHHHVAGEVVSLLVGEEERDAHYGLGELAGHITDFSAAALGLVPSLSETKKAKSNRSVKK